MNVKGLLAVVALPLLCSACGTVSQESMSSSEAYPWPPVSTNIAVSRPVLYKSPILTAPDAEVEAMGKRLLAEYDVGYGQSVRFPYQGQYFEAHGSYALTSLDEARSRYPDWPIPEKLADYQFVDLTVVSERTSVVFPNEDPPPKKSIEVINNRELEQYYLCYRKGDLQFRINMLPMEDKDDRRNLQDFSLSFESWLDHPQVYVEKNESGDFEQLLIESEPYGKYAYFISKVHGTDCLLGSSTVFQGKDENTIIKLTHFSEEEAESILTAIQEGF